MISYDGRVNDYSRYQTRNMYRAIDHLSAEDKQRLVEKLQDQKLQCLAENKSFDSGLLKAVGKRLGGKA